MSGVFWVRISRVYCLFMIIFVTRGFQQLWRCWARTWFGLFMDHLNFVWVFKLLKVELEDDVVMSWKLLQHTDRLYVAATRWVVSTAIISNFAFACGFVRWLTHRRVELLNHFCISLLPQYIWKHITHWNASTFRNLRLQFCPFKFDCSFPCVIFRWPCNIIAFIVLLN